jgi:hypothetical protein
MYGIEQRFSLESARKHPKLVFLSFDRKQHSLGIGASKSVLPNSSGWLRKKSGKCRVAY